MLPQLRISKKIKVYGYTQTDVQSAAAKAANKVLAHHRSEAVITWLKAHGVNAKFIIVAKGVLDPASTTNQALNRRVEFEATF
jgi:outer membrane protein OmpA-like peptidoglycan-associated protein